MSPHIACLLGALALLTACKTTPLDVVYATDVGAVADAGAGAEAGAGAGGSAGSGGARSGGASAGAAGHCSTSSYVLRLRLSGLCLGQGAPTTVFGNPGFLLDFSEDCRGLERAWLLVPTAVPNVFSFQNMAA